MSRYRIRRVFSKLEGLGLVISRKLRASKWDHCKYYTIDNGKLAELLKTLKASICQFSTHPFVENLQMDVTTASKSYQIHNSTMAFQDHERDGAACNTLEKERLTTEESASESFADRQVFVEGLGSERDGRSDQCSAKAEPVVSELDSFKTQLEDLGKKLGRHSPLGWAFRIVQNLRDGKSSTYWEEFKAGVPLGTSEQREWEIAPGVACSIAIQCLHQDYLSRPGTTPQEAALKAARTIARPKEMAAVWESIKSQVMFRRSEWERQSELGVQSPVLDSWMMPKAAVSVEEVAIALNEIQSALPEVLKSKSEFGHDRELKALQGQGKSALTQIAASQLQPTVSAVVESEIAALQGSAVAQIEGAIGTESVESKKMVEVLDLYARTPESLAARERAKASLHKKSGKLTKAEEILAANIAEVEKMPVVESAKTVVVEYDDEPILW